MFMPLLRLDFIFLLIILKEYHSLKALEKLEYQLVMQYFMKSLK